jgi:HK97 family phage major capsid protein
MTQIMELMEKRAKAWEAAKAFLNTHSQNGGMVSAEDAATYDKMEKEVTDLTHDIERLQRQEADRQDDERTDLCSAYRKARCQG